MSDRRGKDLLFFDKNVELPTDERRKRDGGPRRKAIDVQNVGTLVTERSLPPLFANRAVVFLLARIKQKEGKRISLELEKSHPIGPVFRVSGLPTFVSFSKIRVLGVEIKISKIAEIDAVLVKIGRQLRKKGRVFLGSLLYEAVVPDSR